MPGELLAPGVLPGLWSGEELSVQAVLDYFSGGKSVPVDKGGFTEVVPVPKAAAQVVNTAIDAAVASGKVWLLSGPASLLGESIPTGVLSPAALLRKPPEAISAAAILPENLPAAWQGSVTTALAILATLSQKVGQNLPWKTARDVITEALQARFIELAEGSVPWPCELPAAQGVKLKVPSGQGVAAVSAGRPVGGIGAVPPAPPTRIASGDFEPSQIQNLAESIPNLLSVSAKAGIALTFHVRLEVGDSAKPPSDDVIKALNKVLEQVAENFRVD